MRNPACSTKAKREALAACIISIAEKHGATVSRVERDREIRLLLTLGPYSVSINFDGGNSVDAFLGHWCTEPRSNATFPRNFDVTIGGTINEHHFAKATTCEKLFGCFEQSIDDGLGRLADLLNPEIIAHLEAHEAKIAKRRKARTSADQRKKERGLQAAIEHMQNSPK